LINGEDFKDYEAYMGDYQSKDITKLLKIMNAKLPPLEQNVNSDLNKQANQKQQIGCSVSKLITRVKKLILLEGNPMAEKELMKKKIDHDHQTLKKMKELGIKTI
jgi:hypothetical protein